ncbi:MAG: aminotransferase class V-fold PLP-dependent enzyme [Candidatus Marinimicrobia bacterium]|jgi:CDP-4-dehydro-6-deoxyglucose reductase, E1|nr:aminotransferase class V-fold PLP-dependent enzyme [Candidatus Neomarinimicrobiota bacterium]
MLEKNKIRENIKNFIVKTEENHDILNFLYNMNKSDFDKSKDTIYYSGPYWDHSEVVSIFESILTGKWLVSGEKVNKFQRQFSKIFNHKDSVMVNSGSSANLIMIEALKKYYSWKAGDEIIVSAVGFPTTTAPLIQTGLKPVFVDIDMSDLNFDIDEVEKKITNKTKGIFISPVLGNPPDMDRLNSIAEKYDVLLILDNCDSLGSKWDSKNLSDYCVTSSCSFYPAHHITTGEGGMVSSKNEDIIEIARSFVNWGRDCYCVGSANLLPRGTCKKRFSKWIPGLDFAIDHKYIFSNIGYNLKPLDLQGAIGIEQLKKISKIHKKRRINKKKIDKFFEDNIDGIRLVREGEKAETSWFGVPIICDSAETRAKLVSYLEENRIQTRMYFAGNILLHPGYKELDDASKYPNANQVLEKVFFVGCTPTYSDSMISYIEEVILNYKLSCANK